MFSIQALLNGSLIKPCVQRLRRRQCTQIVLVFAETELPKPISADEQKPGMDKSVSGLLVWLTEWMDGSRVS